MEPQKRIRRPETSTQDLRGWVEVPFAAEKAQEGLRLDVFLAERLRGCSRARARRLIDEGRVRLEGREAKAACRLAAGQPVFVRFPRREDPPSEHASLPVLYEDDVLLAVHKPAGVLSHPAARTVRNSVTAILKEQFPGLRLYTVHRLDRETSGVFLLAKSRAAASALAGQFSSRSIRKEYLAIVKGRIEWEWKLVDAPLGREGGEIRVRQTSRPGGTPAVTEFERLAASDARSLVAARPKTGRLHQIRAHLAWLGHPVLGDKLYSGKGEAYLKAARGALTPDDLMALGAPRQLLHARSLTLTHPSTGRELVISAEPPVDFLAYIP